MNTILLLISCRYSTSNTDGLLIYFIIIPQLCRGVRRRHLTSKNEEMLEASSAWEDWIYNLNSAKLGNIQSATSL